MQTLDVCRCAKDGLSSMRQHAGTLVFINVDSVAIVSVAIVTVALVVVRTRLSRSARARVTQLTADDINDRLLYYYTTDCIGTNLQVNLSRWVTWTSPPPLSRSS